MIDEQIAQRLEEALGDLDRRRQRLEASIEELRAFEREYRTRLRAYLEGQLRELSGSGGSDDDGAGVPVGAGGGGGGAAGASFLNRLTCLTNMKMTKAMIMKSNTLCRKTP